MAGKGRASVNDMKRVEVLVLMEIDQQTEDKPLALAHRPMARDTTGTPMARYRLCLYRVHSVR